MLYTSINPPKAKKKQLSLLKIVTIHWDDAPGRVVKWGCKAYLLWSPWPLVPFVDLFIKAPWQISH